MVAAAVAGVFSFVRQERERDLRTWQTRLAIIADSRAVAVGRWFAEHDADDLNGLASNESLQLYMTQLALARGAGNGVSAARAQEDYLKNLLVVTAEHEGFSEPTSGPEVAANVRRLGVAGIGLYDMDGRALVATPSMPPLDGTPRRLLRFADARQREAAGSLPQRPRRCEHRLCRSRLPHSGVRPAERAGGLGHRRQAGGARAFPASCPARRDQQDG